MQKAVFLIIVIWVHNALYGQIQQPIFDHYSNEQGFTAREAFSMASDSKGLLWISTDEGLASYDSKTFRFYKHHPNDSNSLFHNYCKQLLIDKRGWIWIITNNNLDVFNPITQQFKHIKLSGDNGSIQPVYPNKIAYNKETDILWIAAASGLYFCKNGQLLPERFNKNKKENLSLQKFISSVTIENKTTIWLTTDSSILRLDTRNGSIENYVFPQIISGFRNKAFGVFSSYLDKKNTLWLGLWVNGLLEFNTITKKFNQYFYNTNKYAESNTIFAIAQTDIEGQENILWITTEDRGIAGFNTDTHNFQLYTSTLHNDSKGIKGTTYGLYANKHALWIGSNSGLHCYHFDKQIFNTYLLKGITGKNNPVSEIVIEKTANGKDKMLWLYIAYKDAYRYNMETKAVLPVPNKIKKYIEPKTNFFGWFIDSQNLLWISTGQYGLIGYNIEKDIIFLQEKNYFYQDWEWVNTFFEDSKNNIWLGTFRGMYKWDAQSGKIEEVTDINKQLEANHLSKAIMDITEDEKKHIWFITDFSEDKIASIAKYGSDTKQIQIVYNEQKESLSFAPPVELTTLLSDQHGKLYVSFNHQEIKWFTDPYKKKLVLHSLMNETSSGNSVSKLIGTDQYHNVWIQNSFGLLYFKKESNTLVNFPFLNYGLDNIAVNAFFSTQSQTIYIGQTNSFNSLNLLHLNEQKENSGIVFTQVKIFNQVFPHTGPILSGDKIKLDYTQNMISIEFALLSYLNSYDNLYKWKLEGMEKEWNVSKNNTATYTNLKPGKYTLVVWAANSNGEWTRAPIRLFFTISPPFYKTWWFITLCILAIAGLIYWMVQSRINRIREKYSLRNSIASDLHDEIGSTLTSIHILSTVSQQAMEKAPQQAKEMLEQIAMQSKTVQQNMSDIVWSIRPDNEKLASLVTRFREYAAQTLEPLNIHTTIMVEDSILQKNLETLLKKELLLIYKEAINNISKHSGASAASITLKKNGNNITMIISDNGIWKGNNSGTGTKTMQERAKNIGGIFVISTNTTGTTLTLSIPIP